MSVYPACRLNFRALALVDLHSIGRYGGDQLTARSRERI
jgi:hypothetical protein